MKSNAYEMHNYAASLSPDLPSDIPLKGSSTSTKMKPNEKYSLRQRQKRKATKTAVSFEEPNEMDDYLDRDLSPAVPHQKKSKKDKTQDKKQAKANGNGKPRTKAAPLSKYRRKTANARERTRMREINSAFENLRQCVPNVICGEDAGISSEKLTKITTLRLAMKYITILNDALHDPDYDVDYLFESKELQQQQQQQQAQQTQEIPETNPSEKDPQLEAQSAKSKTSKAASKSTKGPRKTPTKRTSYKMKIKEQQDLMNQVPLEHRLPLLNNSDYSEILLSPQSSRSSASSSFSSVSSSRKSISSSTASSSAYSSLSAHSSPSSSYPANYNLLPTNSTIHQSPAKPLKNSPDQFALNPSSFSDLSSLLLESDGESLNLSESCLSPLHNHYHQSTPLMANSFPLDSKAIFNENDFITVSTTSPSAIVENPLELNLRLLDPNPNSLDFNLDTQQPPSCLSPLVTLDSFSPFSDLLQNEFNEHNSLDLFLT